MKLIPLLTAILVTVFLYFLVIERETLLSFAGVGGDDPAQAAEVQVQSAAATDPAASSDETTEDDADDAAASADLGIRVMAMHSKAREIDSAVVLRGQTEAARQVEVRAQTSGQVISTPLRKGSFVTQGQLLCQLDPGTREASLSEAQARLAEARARIPETEARRDEALARLEEARINDNAATKLQQDGFASQTRVASAQAAVRAAEATVASVVSSLQSSQAGIQSAQAAIAAVEKDIERLSITAPFAGLLETDSSELGSLLQPGGLCATVIQLDPIKLVGFAPETEVDRIQIGARGGARLAGGRDVQGRVSFLSRSADPATRTFRVEMEVANEDLTIRDGQSAEIVIASDGATAHLLPQSALTLNDHGDLGVRLVGPDNLVQFAPLTLLRDTIEGVWVTGLPDTADVITLGQEYVTDGVRVRATFQQEATQ